MLGTTTPSDCLAIMSLMNNSQYIGGLLKCTVQLQTLCALSATIFVIWVNVDLYQFLRDEISGVIRRP